MKRKDILGLIKPLMDPIKEGIIVTNADGMVLAQNAAVAELLGLKPGSSIPSLTSFGGLNLRRLLLDASLETETTGNQAAADQHHCEMAVEFDHEFDRGGGRAWLRVSSSLVHLPTVDDRLRYIVLRDISAEKRLFAAMSVKQSCTVATEDPDMLRLLEKLDTVAATEASILFQGESGTGKTLLAKLLHDRSQRRNMPFVEVNCSAIPETLIETELFGHVKGAFTGAVSQRAGRFKAADGGTLFLDEISELPRELQPKLLRVLQDGFYEPVGSDKTMTADVRLITASNQDLRELVDQGRFRADLFYRIAVVPLHLPALRERPGDISLLIRSIRKRLMVSGYSDSGEFTAEAMRAMMNYPWPGNVRELANAVEHAVICAKGDDIKREDLPYVVQDYCNARRNANADSLPQGAAVTERAHIEQALQQAKGNKTLAAQILGIDRSTLWRRMQRFDMA